MNTDVVILSWNGSAFLRPCLYAVLAQDPAPHQVWVVDNGSVDGSAALVRNHFPQVQLLPQPRNLGFAGGMNVGLRAVLATEDVDSVVLLNQDTEVAPGWLAGMQQPFADPAVGVVGCKILLPDGATLQHGGAEILYPRALTQHYGYGELDQGQCDQERDVDYVTGASFGLSLAALRTVGLFDEGYYPAYVEEIDLCYRMRLAGYRVMYTPAAKMIHAEGSSSSEFKRSRMFNRHRLRFVLKQYSWDALWNDFFPAEAAHAASVATEHEGLILQSTYLDALVALPDTLQARMAHHQTRLSQADAQRIMQALIDLRATILAHEPSPIS